jgi:predicted transcriptional regulator YdeE
MAKPNISKAILRDAPVDEVYKKISDFHHWQAWSPWLIQDPQAKVDVEADGKSFHWSGDMAGDGEMEVSGEVPHESVDYHLQFLKPWKSKARVRFEVAETNGGTETTWQMDSSLPFFLFWMKKTMTNLIGMDYERGLLMLKDYVEDGEVHSKLDFQGEQDYAGCQYVGVKTDCTSEQVGPQMQADLHRIWDYLQDRQEQVDGVPFSIYHKWDMARGRVVYTSAIPVKAIPDDLPADMISGSIPATRVYVLRHTGPYEHLGNAWSTLYNMHQRKKIRVE